MKENVYRLIINKYWNYSWFILMLLNALYLVFLGSPTLTTFITISLALIIWGMNLNAYFISEELNKELYDKTRINQELTEKFNREKEAQIHLGFRIWYRALLQEQYGKDFNTYDSLKVHNKKYSTIKYLPR